MRMPPGPPDNLSSMATGWHLHDHHEPLTGKHAAELVHARVTEGQFETWLEHDRGRLLAVVTNGTRAMVRV